MDILTGLDYATFYHFQVAENRIAFFDIFLPSVVQLGTYPVLAAVVLVGAILLRMQRRFGAMLYLLSCTSIGVILAEVTKLLVHHSRPPDWTGPAWAGYSFPSAPAMVSTIVYFGLAYLLTLRWERISSRIVVLVSTIALLVLIGFSLIYLRQQWLSDVLAGWLGAAVVLIFGSWLLDPKKELAQR